MSGLLHGLNETISLIKIKRKDKMWHKCAGLMTILYSNNKRSLLLTITDVMLEKST